MSPQSHSRNSRPTRRSLRTFGECVTAGVDYITLTCKSNDGYDRLADAAARLLRSELDRGEKLSSWRFQNFDGRTAGSVQAGSDGPTFLLRLSGVLAYRHWKEVLPFATNVSRLDLQSTVRLNINDSNFAEQCEAHALKFERAHNHGRQIELRRHSTKGKTVYVGSPQSDRYIRIYSKGRESGLPEFQGCWRGEIQFGKKMAWSMSQQLHDWVSQETFAQKVVFESFRKIGVPWQGLYAKEVLLASPPRPKNTLERKLTWLETQVQPTIKRLMDHYPLEVIMSKLGLGPNCDEGDDTQ